MGRHKQLVDLEYLTEDSWYRRWLAGPAPYEKHRQKADQVLVPEAFQGVVESPQCSRTSTQVLHLDQLVLYRNGIPATLLKGLLKVTAITGGLLVILVDLVRNRVAGEFGEIAPNCLDLLRSQTSRNY